jgi:predicted transcriptional regulator
MQVVQLKLNESIVKQFDALAAERKVSRAKLAEQAMRQMLQADEDRKKDEQTIRAYREQPVTEDERWPEEEQAWPEWEDGAWKEAKSGGSSSKRPTKKGRSSSSRGKRSSRT